VGGANFGNAASNPEKGQLYVIAYDYPSVYKLTKVDPEAPNLTEQEVKMAKGIYTKNCQTCHGADQQGGLGVPLKNIGSRLSWDEFQNIVVGGKGPMPAFGHIGQGEIEALYKYLGGTMRRRGSESDQQKPPVEGPVVASGGAPLKKSIDKGVFGRGGMKDYPEGVTPPEQRYRTGYGLEYMDLMSPPWTSITAYDLNTGTIKWRKPLGENYQITEGRETAGIPGGSARKGMIVTSTGVVFCTSKGGLFYAFDEDTGDVLWKYQMSMESMALPAMYTVHGKEYVVVSATAPFTEHSKDWSKEPGALPAGYLVFSLPDKK
jgi:quinoprotein glucose dehydrogenase